MPVAAPPEPVIRDGAWQNANEEILGADNKVAVATMLVLAQRLMEAPAEVGVELLFTVGEELSLAGAKEFETGVLRSSLGYLFDSAAPVGGVVVASPTHYRLAAELRGVAAHAGVRPENGRSAILAAARAIANMRLGRIDSHTTANIGLISGGSAANVVPDAAASSARRAASKRREPSSSRASSSNASPMPRTTPSASATSTSRSSASSRATACDRRVSRWSSRSMPYATADTNRWRRQAAVAATQTHCAPAASRC